MTASTRSVTSTDGVSLAVHTHDSDDTLPVLLAVHGYPDNHHVWDALAPLLADRFRVVTYDVRGCGDSDKPAGRAAYRQSQLTDDLFAVADAVSPGEPITLLGHDWGSIQCWPALGDPRAEGRFSSYTSISGPSLDHAGAWLRQGRHHPRAALRQLAHSYYIGLFQLPGLPELAARRGLLDRLAGSHAYRTPADQVNGIQLYRANARTLFAPRPTRLGLPVQVIVADQDAYVTAALAEGAPRAWVDDLTVRHIDAGHWVVSDQPRLVAGPIIDFATARVAGTTSEVAP